MKNVDLDEPTSFLDHVYLGCTQRQCKPIEIIIEEYTKMFESHLSAGNLTQKRSRGHLMWKDTRKRCVEGCCELANEMTEQLHKVSALCLDDLNSKKKKWDLLENCEQFARTLF